MTWRRLEALQWWKTVREQVSQVSFQLANVALFLGLLSPAPALFRCTKCLPSPHKSLTKPVQYLLLWTVDISFVPRPSRCPVFDHLQKQMGKAWSILSLESTKDVCTKCIFWLGIPLSTSIDTDIIHIVKYTSLPPSVFAYCKQSKHDSEARLIPALAHVILFFFPAQGVTAVDSWEVLATVWQFSCDSIMRTWGARNSQSFATSQAQAATSWKTEIAGFRWLWCPTSAYILSI